MLVIIANATNESVYCVDVPGKGRNGLRHGTVRVTIAGLRTDASSSAARLQEQLFPSAQFDESIVGAAVRADDATQWR